jgi:hypothetical protein
MPNEGWGISRIQNRFNDIDSLTQQAKNRIRQENKLQQRNRIWHETCMNVFW